MVLRINKKLFMIILMALILLAVIFCINIVKNLSVTVSTNISNWGLKFNADGTVPMGM